MKLIILNYIVFTRKPLNQNYCIFIPEILSIVVEFHLTLLTQCCLQFKKKIYIYIHQILHKEPSLILSVHCLCKMFHLLPFSQIDLQLMIFLYLIPSCAFMCKITVHLTGMPFLIFYFFYCMEYKCQTFSKEKLIYCFYKHKHSFPQSTLRTINTSRLSTRTAELGIKMFFFPSRTERSWAFHTQRGGIRVWEEEEEETQMDKCFYGWVFLWLGATVTDSLCLPCY